MRLRFGHQHLRFWPILTRFVDYYSPFWGSKAISMVVEPKVCLRVGHQHSQFWPILARFVDYYSQFLGPGVIYTINEPWGAFPFRSSTLAVLADSEPFRGLLLTIFGPQTNFHSC